jgi:hypothetical protein
MPAIKVLQHDEDAQEAILEIVTSLYEATQAPQVSLRVCCHPISLPVISNKISLLGFLVTNIVSENALQAPQKTNCGYFGYRLFARVLDVRNRCVQLGDIDIVLDCPIPKDIPKDSYISFDVVRLDLQC